VDELIESAQMLCNHDVLTKDEFTRLFLNDIPLIDTRSPAEFSKGSFANAINLPLMDNEERRQVGTLYKNEGQAAAIALGHQLVSGNNKQHRLSQWIEFTEQHPQGYLFCWRGGLRSQIVQSWLAESSVTYPRIEGGYKALRRFLIDKAEQILQQRPLVLLAGRTGSGKTEILNRLPVSIDLEGLANHRGSSFGRRPGGQPSQILFENNFAVALLKIQDKHKGSIILEDESGFIGSCSLPLTLYKKMQASPKVLLQVPLQTRVKNILNDYIIKLLEEYQRLDPEHAFALYTENLCNGLSRLKKRLGNEQHQQILQILEQALQIQQQSGETEMHTLWIEQLLVNYYDPTYDYQLDKKTSPVLFSGDETQVRQWLLRYQH
jgi:tRNA 2-selenouridine synthase